MKPQESFQLLSFFPTRGAPPRGKARSYLAIAGRGHLAPSESLQDAAKSTGLQNPSRMKTSPLFFSTLAALTSSPAANCSSAKSPSSPNLPPPTTPPVASNSPRPSPASAHPARDVQSLPPFACRPRGAAQVGYVCLRRERRLASHGGETRRASPPTAPGSPCRGAPTRASHRDERCLRVVARRTAFLRAGQACAHEG